MEISRSGRRGLLLAPEYFRSGPLAKLSDAHQRGSHRPCITAHTQGSVNILMEVHILDPRLAGCSSASVDMPALTPAPWFSTSPDGPDGGVPPLTCPYGCRRITSQPPRRTRSCSVLSASEPFRRPGAYRVSSSADDLLLFPVISAVRYLRVLCQSSAKSGAI